MLKDGKEWQSRGVLLASDGETDLALLRSPEVQRGVFAVNVDDARSSSSATVKAASAVVLGFTPAETALIVYDGKGKQRQFPGVNNDVPVLVFRGPSMGSPGRRSSRPTRNQS